VWRCSFFDRFCRDLSLPDHRIVAVFKLPGAVSGTGVLDLDAKHDAARPWWAQHEHLFPPTRRFRTRGGGMHLYFRHQPGIGNTQAKIAPGIDTRGDGGFVSRWCDGPN